jgi:hypothetical protein
MMDRRLRSQFTPAMRAAWNWLWLWLTESMLVVEKVASPVARMLIDQSIRAACRTSGCNACSLYL